MRAIPILSDQLSAAELETLMQAELEKDAPFKIKVEEEKEGHKDTATLVALISGGLPLIGVVIAQIVTILLKIYELNRQKADNKIVIKGKNGRSIEFPADASEEDIEKYIALAVKLEEEEGGIKYIATVN